MPPVRHLWRGTLTLIVTGGLIWSGMAITGCSHHNPKSERFDERYVEPQSKKQLDILWIGDSITDQWKTVGHDTLEKKFAGKTCAFFSIPGDTTSDVIRRLHWCKFDNVDAKVTVLMIGTNDLTDPRNSAEFIGNQVKQIIEFIQQKMPKTQIVLMALLPRHQSLNDPIEMRVEAVNKLFKGMGNGSNIHFLDIGNEMLEPNGEISDGKMAYFLHLTPDGYVIWGNQLRLLIDGLCH